MLTKNISSMKGIIDKNRCPGDSKRRTGLPSPLQTREVWSSAHLLCVRYSGKEPFFKETCGGTVCLEVGRINH